MTIRDKFIDDLAKEIIERRNITLYGKFEGIPNTKLNPVREPHPLYESGYAQGLRDTIGTMLGITDSRELNGARYRLTDTTGEVITFYPKDNENGAPTRDDTGEIVDVPGLIVAVWEKVSS